MSLVQTLPTPHSSIDGLSEGSSQRTLTDASTMWSADLQLPGPQLPPVVESVRPRTLDLRTVPSTQESLFSLSADSQRTTTDTSTIWGPGTLSGRALLALGEATIRGIDALIIRRRLATIRLRAPSLTRSMCDDLLELCRPNMYSIRIAKQAIGLTLAHICAGAESSLHMFVVCLCRWPQQEARLILLELVRSTSQVNRPRGWELKRLYDFLVVIIQVKAGWRRIVAEAAILLDQTCPPVIAHPVQFLSAEVTAGLPESPLSSLQDAYSVDIRSKTWIALLKCDFPLRDRMVEIQYILQETQISSGAQIVDALADASVFQGSYFDLDTQSSALTCVQSITLAQWRSILEHLELPADAFNPNFVWDTDIIACIHALVFLRKPFCTPASDIAGVPQILTNTAASMMLGKIYQGSDVDIMHCALGICKLSGDEVQIILKALISNALPSIRQTIQENCWAVGRLCQFLTTILQITGESFSPEVATTLSGLRVVSGHPVVVLTFAVGEKPPLAKLQVDQHWYFDSYSARFDTWAALQRHGLPLELRMMQIERTLSEMPRVTNNLIFDAIADASLFTSNHFSSELRSAAFDQLLQFCLNSRWEVFHEPLTYYPSFYDELELRVQSGEQTHIHDMATLWALQN
ncbi:hypothetical protein DFH06DRAFT_1229153 [Mycena polygramma]|nr:hypothetical protein DFH06DRAFT_1229153 [Mycena polygramma]